MTRIISIQLAVLIFLLIAACSQKDADSNGIVDKGALIPENPAGNTIMYVSNQSYALPLVDIKILIDEKPIIASDFAVEDQHNYVKYEFDFPEGKHILRVVSKGGDASIEKEIEVKGKSWIHVGYWYSSEDGKGRNCYVIFSDQPMGFR